MNDNQSMDDREYAWNYFNFHADQRLKTFNFFIIITTIFLGGIFPVLTIKNYNYLILIGLPISFFSYIFWKLDIRNKELISVAESELKKLEESNTSKLFIKEYNYTKDKKKHFSFTDSFNLVFLTYGFIGLFSTFLIIIYDTYKGLFFSEFNNFIHFTSIILLIFITFVYLFILLKTYTPILDSFLSTVITIILLAIIFNNNLKYLNNKFNDSNALKLIKEFVIYYEKGNINLNNNLLTNKEIEQSIDTLFKSLNKDNSYSIKIIGFSSSELLNNSNKIADNYQLSLARAENIKKYLMDVIIKYDFNINKIFINTYANSNENTINSEHDLNRKVTFEIYLISKEDK